MATIPIQSGRARGLPVTRAIAQRLDAAAAAKANVRAPAPAPRLPSPVPQPRPAPAPAGRGVQAISNLFGLHVPSPKAPAATRAPTPQPAPQAPHSPKGVGLPWNLQPAHPGKPTAPVSPPLSPVRPPIVPVAGSTGDAQPTITTILGLGPTVSPATDYQPYTGTLPVSVQDGPSAPSQTVQDRAAGSRKGTRCRTCSAAASVTASRGIMPALSGEGAANVIEAAIPGPVQAASDAAQQGDPSGLILLALVVGGYFLLKG